MTQEMKELAKELYMANKVKNAASRKESAAKKKLEALMEKEGVTEFESTIRTEDGVTKLHTSFVKKVTSVIDVQKLSKLLDPSTFWKCVTATKTNVDKYAGKAITEQVSVEQPAKQSLTVKAQ